MYYHLKIIIRNLRRNGLYSWINIAGLAVCLATVILVTLWVNDELRFDKFHKLGKDIHHCTDAFDGRMEGHQSGNGKSCGGD